jgi:TonB family protein
VVRVLQIGLLLIFPWAELACGTAGQASPAAGPGQTTALNHLGQNSVLLRIRVGADGSVREAHVIEGAGKEFDDFALSAASQFKFNPARRQDGTPVEAVINYRFTFKFKGS